MVFELEVNAGRIIGEHVLRYAGKLINSDKYLVEALEKSDDNYIPILKIPYGTHTIPFKDKLLDVEYTVDREVLVNSGVFVEKVILKSSESIEYIYSFLDAARKNSLNYKTDKVTTRIIKKGHWNELSSLPKRELESVVLDKDQLDSIIKDVEEFVESEDEYLKKGVPYKRNYLLEGLPGTGKTSLIFAIASHLDMDICIINFSNAINDINFMDCVSNMDQKSILVLEDIDCVFGNRMDSKCGISFPGILNVLDGMARKHKLITFMTTNFMENLDSALIRPGRIDYQLKFDHCTKEQSVKMYRNLVNNIQEDDAKNFSKKVNRLKFTTAALQKFLFKYRNNTYEELVEKVEELEKMGENTSNSKMYM